MTQRAARWILFLGTLSSLGLFLALTVDTHRQVYALSHADKLDERVVAGKRAWHRYNCNDCHTILGFGSYYGPDLTKVYLRQGAEGITRAVRTPEQVTTWRKMPHLPLRDEELGDLVAFLRWTGEIDTHDWPPQDRRLHASVGRAAVLGVGAGANLFRERGCFACHRLDGTGGLLGPDLSHVGARLPYETIDAVLTAPRSVNPHAMMPAPGLLPEEREELARFLAGLS
jgi:nitric oxide reductase subunit C